LLAYRSSEKGSKDQEKNAPASLGKKVVGGDFHLSLKKQIFFLRLAECSLHMPGIFG
jgi:hypothetical protein